MGELNSIYFGKIATAPKMLEVNDILQEVKNEIESLKDKIKKGKEQLQDCASLKDFASTVPDAGAVKLKVRRVLKGHVQRINAMRWSDDKHRLVSAGQDAKLIVWDAFTGAKEQTAVLKYSMIGTCAISPSGKLVACAGLDGICSIYNLRSREVPLRPWIELSGHTGMVSCCRFLGENQMITSSGDCSCMLWDVESAGISQKFADHTSDVTAVAINPSNQNVFVSVSGDNTAKLWDIRSGKVLSTFKGHTAEINCIEFLRTGAAFVTGSDDATIKLFDIRAQRELNTYTHTGSPCTSIALSATGKYIFAVFDDTKCYVYDILKTTQVGTLDDHLNKVSCVGVSSDGTALATGSWDCTIKVWA